MITVKLLYSESQRDADTQFTYIIELLSFHAAIL